MMEKIISVAEARQSFAEVLGQVAFARQTFLVTKKGKPVARIVPVEPSPEFTPRTLPEVPGWLDADDPFFEHLQKARRNSGLARTPFARKSKR